jgi:hypothetical protein
MSRPLRPSSFRPPVAILCFSLLAALLSGCGGENPPRLSDAGPRPAEPPSADALSPRGGPGAVLVANGRQSFAGSTPLRCAVQGESGLQINLRTGDPNLPAVAVRIEDLAGLAGMAETNVPAGPFRAGLFVTGRSRTGGLVESAGEASVRLERDPAQGSSQILRGSFEGTYQGEAGKGTVHGRFEGCAYPGTLG